MSTIIRGGSITVDGLAPSGGGNNPTVDNLTVNNNVYAGGGYILRLWRFKNLCYNGRANCNYSVD